MVDFEICAQMFGNYKSTFIRPFFIFFVEIVLCFKRLILKHAESYEN